MPSTTSRLSVVALSTLAALVAQELARTAHVTPSTLASLPESGDREGTKPLAPTKPELTQPIATPETLALPPLANSPKTPEWLNSPPPIQLSQSAPTGRSDAVKPGEILSSGSNGLMPAPLLPPPLINPPLKTVDINHLPIDTFVAASLQQSASQVVTPARPKANRPLARKSTDSKATVATRSSKPPARTTVQPLTLPDIQNHPSQKAIEALIQRGVIHGSQDGTFRPDAPVSDIEFQIMLRNAFKRSPETVATLQRPGDVVTRADAAEFIYSQLQRAESIAKAKTVVDAPIAPPGMTVAAVSTPEMVPETATAEKAATPSAPTPLASTPFPPLSPASSPTLPPALQALPSPLPSRQVSTMPLQGTPATALTPAQEDYTLGAGDRIRVEIFGVPEYSRDYQIGVNGNLKLYLVGDLRVQGMTLVQAEKAIAARYARLVQRIKVDVTLTTPRPMNVAIAGEISRPGSYTVTTAEGAQFPTVTRLIQQAGGLTQSANPNVIYIRRPQANGTEQLITVDLWDLMKTGNIRQDLALRDRDSIFIPPASQINPADAAQLAAANFTASASQPINIAIVGEVARPGPYVLSRGRGGTGGGTGEGGGTGTSGGLVTVTQAIQQAGGITSLADLRNVQIKRTTRSSEPQIVTLNLWDMLKTGDLSQDLVLQQGDTITIPTATAINPAEASQLGSASFAPDTVRVNVVGEVVSPGVIQVPPNTTLNQAILAAGGFNNKRAYKKTVELIRLNPNGTATRLSIPVDLSRGIDEKNNPILRNNDIIVINRSGLARFTDTLDTILTPVNRLLPFFLLGL